MDMCDVICDQSVLRPRGVAAITYTAWPTYMEFTRFTEKPYDMSEHQNAGLQA